MWFTKKIKDIFKELSSSMNGLSEEQVSTNREKYGKNALEKEASDSIGKIIISNIKEPLTLVLIGVIIICFFIQEYKEVVIISVIIAVNIAISTSQELKSQKALDSLEKMTSPKSTVIRENKTLEINSDELVVGDIILLEAGNYVPADIRIIELASLNVDESALTGESLVVEKSIDEIDDETTSLGDRLNMLYSSTFITNGRAKGIVVAVGADTEIGKIADLINKAPKHTTPLQDRLAQLSLYVSIFAFIIAGIIFVLNFFINKVPLAEGFVTAITLAVAVIPESLPVIVSIILALSVSKMAQHNAIIKKLPAVESLGTVNVICTDKTGTLTLNKMSVTDYFVADHNINETPLTLDDKLIQAMVLCNDSFVDSKGNPIGDPTELALTYYANSFGIKELDYREKFPRIDEVPFDSSRKLMSTIHEIDENIISYTKGAIDQILAQATHIEDDQGRRRLTQQDKDKILKYSNELSSQALRVLAFAYSRCGINDELVCERNLTFLGAVGMIDPEKQEAKVAIAKAKKAGIKTVMITGDHPTTAFAIAKKLEMVDDESQVITGKELDTMSDDELAKNVNNYCVYSRVSPEHKVKIVQALQKQGFIVSMTGDGVNDAPSLQTAHIGVAMGITGTDVAKQASSMILMDDNFATIVYAVEEGRNIYNKIKRAVQFVLATNFGEVFAIFIAVLMGIGTPLGAVHVLWVNLIVESLIAIPISMDVNDPTVMNEKPRPKNETIFAHMILSIILLSIFVGGALLLSYMTTLNLGYDLDIAKTVAFMVMSCAPMLYVLSLRTPKKLLVVSKPWENMSLLSAIAIGFLLNVVLVYSPLNIFFNLVPLIGMPLIIAIIGILVPTILYEIYKLFTIKKTS
ncbi:Ca2+-transporting ATPase [Bacilli bacterium PM5-3]|nr:Ca2+-transporting ATPase [Bacilli bacterium PM5-3]